MGYLIKPSKTFAYICFVQLKELEKMSYRCLAFGIFEDDVQDVTTSDCSNCVSVQCLEYIHALTVAGTLL